ncbi:MAG: cupin domain-containing protein [Alphaproteobacteria bacterium]|nr:cupin domain-containing protein [Alphaproteobacteria bacterium]MBU0795664.1 cupin domain-containing protein [Alphaproteobacteria bacterium]MBU0887287.1 cupin domain-containing protein [Alphaproteobacteria bacterium]MBU1811832.1 cupin domain-containing protein [Alphaproteobacteria bacterium]
MAGAESNSGFGLFDTYFQLRADGVALPMPVTPEFWAELGTEKLPFAGWLVSSFEMQPGATHWECHPQGDEIVFMLSGAIDVVLEEEAGNRTLSLAAGQSGFIPRGLWHQIVIHAPSRTLFLTAGEGTEHRA